MTIVLTKQADSELQSFSITKKSDGDTTVLYVRGPVIVPREIDTQKEASEAEDIQAQAHEWLKAGRVFKVDTNHDLTETGDAIVESAIARKGDPDFKEGTWWVTLEASQPTTVEKIETGNLNAFSWRGPVDRQAFLALVDHPLEASGTTEKSDGPYPTHKHEVKVLLFDDDAKVIATKTEIAYGHQHDIKGTTRTEQVDGHAHGLKITRE